MYTLVHMHTAVECRVLVHCEVRLNPLQSVLGSVVGEAGVHHPLRRAEVG